MFIGEIKKEKESEIIHYYLHYIATFPPEGRERCSPVHNGLRATPGESTPKVVTTGKTTATPKITFFANC